MEEKMITMTESEYDRMQRDLDWLQCLEAAGVDNWSGIDEAISIFNKNKND